MFTLLWLAGAAGLILTLNVWSRLARQCRALILAACLLGLIYWSKLWGTG